MQPTPCPTHALFIGSVTRKCSRTGTCSSCILMVSRSTAVSRVVAASRRPPIWNALLERLKLRETRTGSWKRRRADSCAPARRVSTILHGVATSRPLPRHALAFCAPLQRRAPCAVITPLITRAVAVVANPGRARATADALPALAAAHARRRCGVGVRFNSLCHTLTLPSRAPSVRLSTHWSYVWLVRPAPPSPRFR